MFLAVLQYLALAVVLIWTMRMARAKGKNPWLWGGLCLGLIVIPEVKFLAVIPALFLMFTKPSLQQGGAVAEQEPGSCPRCQAHLVRDARFCTSCGWDLAELYNPEAASPGTATEDKEPAAPQAAEDLEPALASETHTETTAEAQPQPAAEAEPEPEPAPPPFTPPRKPATLVPPTAAGMTERGVTMFNQGRFQEAIDQFTKAIALDPTYVEAWARRAEAYAQLGRGTEADEDRRRLDALNAG